MLGFLVRWSINLLALVTAAKIIDGIRIQTLAMGILAAGILGIVNAVIRPVVLILTLPINLLTLGLFTLVINAALLKLVSESCPVFIIESFRAAFGRAPRQHHQLGAEHLYQRRRPRGLHQGSAQERRTRPMTVRETAGKGRTL
jgi:putative membrane protein